MAYWRDAWRFADSTEYEFKYAGRYGAKGEKRAPKKKPTKEQIRKQNQRNREKRMRRLVKANFQPGDLWCTLKYPAGDRPAVDEARKDLKRFLAKLRGRYKKAGAQLKFICRMEAGKKGGIHIHILANRIKGMDTDRIIQGCWDRGRVNFESIYRDGGFRRLAEYIVKQPEEDGQLSLFAKEEQKELLKYSCSRNLARPEPERKYYSRRTLRKLIEEGPEPSPGYYIDQDSVAWGVNRYTGMSWLHYTEIRIREEEADADGEPVHRHKQKRAAPG